MTDNTNVWFGLQSALHEGLSAFINGVSLTRMSYLLYPWVDRLEAGFWTSWGHRAQHLLRQIGVTPNEVGLLPIPQSASTVGPPIVARFLAYLSAWLDAYMPAHLAAQNYVCSIPCLKPFDRAEYERGGAYLEPVLALQHFAIIHLSDLIVGLYLHGSMSTLDYVAGSSDLDALVVVKQTTVCAADKLLLLRRHLLHTLRWFYRVDYSQHHGYAVLSDLDLRYYTESLFPSVLFSYLTPLTGASSLTIRRRHERDDPAVACRRTAAYIRKVSAAPGCLLGWFAMKFYLQSVLLLPTLYLQAKGVRVYKRDAFTLARPHFSDEAWRIVDKASQIRNLGPQKSLLAPRIDDFLARLPSPWLASLVHRKLRNQVSDQVRAVLGNNWQADAVRFVDEIESKLSYED
jgi:hypothetical protein